ncbi:hypothetical protein QCD79_34860, partial [Pseudomonas quasicaspiana]|nr:hypothetical protein [Pseudomonas quasicaspiana]
DPVGAAEGCEAFILTNRHRSLRQLLQIQCLLRDSAVSLTPRYLEANIGSVGAAEGCDGGLSG